MKIKQVSDTRMQVRAKGGGATGAGDGKVIGYIGKVRLQTIKAGTERFP